MKIDETKKGKMIIKLTKKECSYLYDRLSSTVDAQLESYESAIMISNLLEQLKFYKGK